ncbi:MAG: formate dehydrogenase [Sphingobium sp.]|nr:formate dehydrogenase [Sphingobium sp.]
MSTGDRLIYMANQIAKNLAARGDEEAIGITADHIKAYWDPLMRSRVADLLAQRSDEFSPIAAEAVRRIHS